MPRYRVIIHGRNFRLNLEGQWEKMSFYTPRFADAIDTLLAEHTVLEDFRQSTNYQDLMKAALNSEDDPPELCCEDIEEVQPGTGAGQPPAGLVLYSELGDQDTDPEAA